MKKFYVYSFKDQKNNLILVEDTKEFAKDGYDPALMKYTGIMVEANNHEEAINIYCHPKENDGYYMADEPIETANRSIIHHTKDSIVNDMRLLSLGKIITDSFDIMCDSIRQIIALTKPKDLEGVTEEELYRNVKERVAQQFLEHRPDG